MAPLETASGFLSDNSCLFDLGLKIKGTWLWKTATFCVDSRQEKRNISRPPWSEVPWIWQGLVPVYWCRWRQISMGLGDRVTPVLKLDFQAVSKGQL